MTGVTGHSRVEFWNNEAVSITGPIGGKIMGASCSDTGREYPDDSQDIITQSVLLTGAIAKSLDPAIGAYALGQSGGIIVHTSVVPRPRNKTEYRTNALAMSLSLYTQARIQTRLMIEQGLPLRGGISCGIPDNVGYRYRPVVPIDCATRLFMENEALPFVTIDGPSYLGYMESMTRSGLSESEPKYLFFRTRDGRLCLDYFRAQIDLAILLRDNGARRFIMKPAFYHEEHKEGVVRSIQHNGVMIAEDPKLIDIYRWIVNYHNWSMGKFMDNCGIDEAVLGDSVPESVKRNLFPPSTD